MGKTVRRRWLLLACGVQLALTGSAQAASAFSLEIGSSPNPVGSGARAMGQGNAFIAVADDATAASWNPGGLVQLERPEASLAVETLARQEGVSSHAHPESETSDTIALSDLNYASGVYPVLCGRNLVLSLNYLKLFRFDRELSMPVHNVVGGDTVDMRYDFHQQGTFSTVTPAIAANVTQRLYLGAALNVWNDDLTQSSSYTTLSESEGRMAFTVPPISGRFRFRDENRYTVEDGYSVVLGALYRAGKHWNLGAVAKPGFTLRLDHERTQEYRPAAPIPGGYTTVSQDRAELSMPWVLGAGAAWKPVDPLTVSADVTWTQWSQYAVEENGVTTNPLTGRSPDQDPLRDTCTLRLGTEYLLIGDTWIVPLRCGAGYDPAPAVEDVDEFFTLSLGTGLQVERFMFDLAYEYRWGVSANTASLRGIAGNEDIQQHRILASLIVYF